MSGRWEIQQIFHTHYMWVIVCVCVCFYTVLALCGKIHRVEVGLGTQEKNRTQQLTMRSARLSSGLNISSVGKLPQITTGHNEHLWKLTTVTRTCCENKIFRLCWQLDLLMYRVQITVAQRRALQALVVFLYFDQHCGFHILQSCWLWTSEPLPVWHYLLLFLLAWAYKCRACSKPACNERAVCSVCGDAGWAFPPETVKVKLLHKELSSSLFTGQFRATQQISDLENQLLRPLTWAGCCRYWQRHMREFQLPRLHSEGRLFIQGLFLLNSSHVNICVPSTDRLLDQSVKWCTTCHHLSTFTWIEMTDWTLRLQEEEKAGIADPLTFPLLLPSGRLGAGFIVLCVSP